MQFGEVESEVSAPLVKLCSALQSTSVSKLTSQQFLRSQGRIAGCVTVQGGIKRHKPFAWILLPSPSKTADNECVSYFIKSLFVSFV